MVLNGLPSWLARPHPMDDLHMAVPAAASAQAGELFWIVERDVLPSDRAEIPDSEQAGVQKGVWRTSSAWLTLPMKRLPHSPVNGAS